MLDLDTIVLKPEWMRPPSWRWTHILTYLANPELELSKIHKDAVLFEGARFYRELKQSKKDIFNCRRKYPNMQLAYDIFTNNQFGGWRWWFEALILSGLTDKEIIDIIKVPCPEESIMLFRKVYFDVEAYRTSQVAVMANLLSTSKASIDVKYDCDFIWKLFAYTWGPQAFLEQFQPGRKDVSRRHLKWFQDMAKENITVNSFQITSGLRIQYNEELLNVLKVAKEYWSIKEEDLATAERLASESFTADLSKHINMILLNADRKMPAVESTSFSDFVLEKTG